MRFIISLVLCYFCFDSVHSSNVNQDSVGPKSPYSDAADFSSVDKEALTKEDDECTLEKLEPLQFMKLFDRAIKSDYCRTQANVVFKKKYEFWHINLCGRKETVESPDGKKYALFIGCRATELFLSTFGSSINQLEIEDTEDKSNQLGGLVSNYCADKLEHLLIKTSRSGIFDKMKKTFERVESLAYVGDSFKEANMDIKLDQLFPRLSSLEITGFAENTIFNAQFPKLIQFQAERCVLPNNTEFFQKNSQIKSLDIKYIDFNLLNNIRENLKQLETLSIGLPSDQHIYEGQPLRFDTVKTLRLSGIGMRLQSGKLIFDNLVTMNLKVLYHLQNDEWVKFLDENKHVKHLTLYGLNDTILSTLADHLNDLEIARFPEAIGPITAGTVTMFLTNNSKLKRCLVTLEQADIDDVVADLQKNLEKSYDIRKLRFNTIQMAKKAKGFVEPSSSDNATDNNANDDGNSENNEAGNSESSGNDGDGNTVDNNEPGAALTNSANATITMALFLIATYIFH